MRPRPTRPRRSLAPLLVVAVALTAAVVGGLWFTGGSGRDAPVEAPEESTVTRRSGDATPLEAPDLLRPASAAPAGDSTPTAREDALAAAGPASLALRLVDHAQRDVTGARAELRPRVVGEGEGAAEESKAAASVSLAFDAAAARYTGSDLAPGRWTLHVHSVAHDPFERPVRLEPGENELYYVLPRRPNVAGVVLDPDGVPVPGARIRFAADAQAAAILRRGSRLLNAGDRSRLFHADERGRFRSRLPAGRARLWCEAPIEGAPQSASWLNGDVLEVELHADGVVDGLVLSYRRGRGVYGVALDEHDRPRSGVRVLLAPYFPGGGRSLLSRSRAVHDWALTDRSGRFAFEGLDDGEYALSARVVVAPPSPVIDLNQFPSSPAEWMGHLLHRARVVVDGADVRGVVLGGSRGATLRLHGRVTRGGAPARGGCVAYLPDDGSFPEHVFATTLGDAGSYELTVPAPGRGVLAFAAEGPSAVSAWSGLGTFTLGTVTRAIALPDEREHRVDLELAPGTGAVSGRVVIEGDIDADVVALTLRATGGPALQQGSVFVEHALAARPEFTFEGLPAGEYELVASSSDRPPPGMNSLPRPTYGVTGEVLVEDGRATEGVVVTVRAGRTLYVTLDGAPHDEFGRLVVRDAAGRIVKLVRESTSLAGIHQVRDVPLVPLTIEAVGRAGVTAAVSIDAEDRGYEVIHLRYEAAPSLVVRATKDGAPAWVALRVIDGAGVERASAGAFDRALARDAAARATYDLGALPPGEYRLEATLADGTTRTRALDWRGGDAPVEWALDGR